MIHQIALKGCDDVTTFDVDLSEAEALLVERIAARSREASEFSCMPTMHLTPGASPPE